MNTERSGGPRDGDFFAAIDDAMAGIVSVEPSREFLSGVRARIAAAPTPRHSIWRAVAFGGGALPRAVATAVAIVLALAVGAGVYWSRRPRVYTSSVCQFPVQAMVTVKPPTVRATPVAVHASRRTAEGVAKRLKEPEVLVPKQELSDVLEFYERSSFDRVELASLASSNNANAELSIPPIRITRLEGSVDLTTSNQGEAADKIPN